MCCQANCSSSFNQTSDCLCQNWSKGTFLSRKMRIEGLRQYATEMEERLNDLKEYIKELETGQ